MNNWHHDLNRLCTEFRFGVGDLAEIPVFCDEANAELGELHPDMWDLYLPITQSRAAQLLAKIAFDVNQFEAGSWEAYPFAKVAFGKVLDSFLAQRISPMALCKIVHELDSAYILGSANLLAKLNIHAEDNAKWLVDMGNSCDWCDDSWTFENSEHLAKEAKRASALLANLAPHGTDDSQVPRL